MCHEHFTCNGDFPGFYTPDPNLTDKTHPFEMKNLGLIRQYPFAHHENLQQDTEIEAVTQEIKEYKKMGGNNIVELTTHGINRDIPALVKLSQDTGVNVVAGTGYYVTVSQTADVLKMTEEKLYDSMLTEILSGCDGTSVRCGVIGELGCSHPLTDFEKRVLRAGAAVQAETKCPLTIHPGRHHKAPFEIVRILQEAGVNINKVVMGHLDRTIGDLSELSEFAALGTYCEWDLFGMETSHYMLCPKVDMLSDAQRIRHIKHLLDEGRDDKIVIAQDIHTKHRLAKFGGHGFSHILRTIVPMMRIRDITQEQIDKILIDNPTKWLTFGN